MPPPSLFCRIVFSILLLQAGGPVPASDSSATAAPAAGIIRGNTKARILIEDFTGSTGQTTQDAVTDSLERTGDFLFGPGASSFVISAICSGGRIQGSVKDPAGKLLFSANYDNLNLRINAHQFADEIVSAIFGRTGVATTQIAFVSDASGHREIYMCDADGADIRQITSDKSACVSPSLRNDALFLAFTSYVSGYPDLYLIDLGTGTRRRIANAPGTNSGAAFSPDGERLAMTMSFSGNPELYVTNEGGLGGRRLTNTPWAESSPAWAPDGTRLVFAANPTGKPQLYVQPLAGGKPLLLQTGSAHCTEPSWSPDGYRIAFTVRQGRRLMVAILNTTTGSTRILTEGMDPCWGADGRHLVYAQNEYLIVHNVDSGAKRIIVSHMGRLSEPSWSH